MMQLVARKGLVGIKGLEQKESNLRFFDSKSNALPLGHVLVAQPIYRYDCDEWESNP